MTPNKDWFETFKSVDGGQVLLGNNKSCKVLGVGYVRIKMHNGMERILQNVRHILELKRNLISLGTLESNGLSYKAVDGVLKVTRGCLCVMCDEGYQRQWSLYTPGEHYSWSCWCYVNDAGK